MVSSLVNLFVFGNFFSKGFGMNDALLYGSLVCGGLLAVLAFVTFHTYGGVKDNMSNAKIGKVYNFEYEQPLHGEPERFCAKVVAVQTFTKDQIERMNNAYRYRRNDNNFVRTSHLVTAQTPDGKLRNFYAERTRNVRRPLLGGVVFNSPLAAFLF
jgi:hypothetical protein